MKFTHIFILACIALGISTACDDSSTIGSSLVTDRSEVIIDSAFTVSGTPRTNTDLQSRTVTQILGALDAKEFGRFKSDIVTQFMPAMQLDTVGVGINDIDSIKMLMFMKPGDFTGDSLVPMGLKVYPLTRQLPSPIYSNFNPEGYYDPANVWTPQTQIYTANALYNDSVNNLAYRTISVDLPLSFAKRFYNEYITNPATFATPGAFAEFFPGVYIKSTFGSGLVVNINETRINLYYKKHDKVTKNDVTRDTVYKVSSTYMAVTPEVVTNNIIDLSLSSSLSDMADAGENIIVAPSGYDVQLTFPTLDIINRYKTNGGDLSVINTLTFSIPVEEITNNYGIEPPVNVLLILSKDKKDFFADNKINDDKTSFIASYNSTTKTYDFTAMRQYIIDMLAKDEIKAEDYTFTLTPVDLVVESTQGSYYQQGQSYITGINPYVSGPAMCKLLLDDAKIKFTYSKQTVNY